MISVNDQPATADSVTVFEPKPAPETVNVVSLSSVPSASSSSENAPNEPVNPKSCASFGTASLTIVTFASLVFVKTHLIFSPDWALNVAVLPASLEFGGIVSPEQVMSVSVQPAGTLSVEV